MRYITDSDPRRTRRVIEAIEERTGCLHVRRSGTRKCSCGRVFINDQEHRKHLGQLALVVGVLP